VTLISTLLVLPLLISALLSLVVAGYAWPRRYLLGVWPLWLIGVAIAVWSVGYALEIVSPTAEGKIFWGQVQYIGIALVPFAFLWFAVSYTGVGQTRPWQYTPYLSIIPLITIILAFTTTWHGLIWQEINIAHYPNFSVLSLSYGLWFWVHFLTSYLFLFAASILLLRGMWRLPGLHRAQSIALMVAVLAPWVSNVLFFANLSPIPGLDLTPFAFTITVLALAWAVFGYQLADATPLARHLVLERMPDGVLVFNPRGVVLDINPAAARSSACPNPRLWGDSAQELLVPMAGVGGTVGATAGCDVGLVGGAGGRGTPLSGASDLVAR
jgi:hypothetical protein